MPYRLDLELPGAALVLIILLPVLALAARRRWRLAAARAEEVMRLAILAADESARAEAEANLAFASESARWRSRAEAEDPPPPPPQCAVCYRPTTTRCSRCKAVRYCSGKCQILHWRQGHKENCHSPQVDDRQESISHLNGVQAERSDLGDNNVEVEGNQQARPFEEESEISASSESNYLEVFREDDNFENRPLVDTSETESCSDSFTMSSSSSRSTFSGLMETSDDASSSEISLPHSGRLGDASSSSIFPDSIRISDADKGEHLKVSPSRFDTASLCVNNAFLSNNFQQKVATRIEVDDCGLVAPKRVSSVGSVRCTTSTKTSENIGEHLHVDAPPNSCASRSGRAGISAYSDPCQAGDCVRADSGSPFQMSPDLSAQQILFNTTYRTENSARGASTLEGTVQFKHRGPMPLDTEKSCASSGRRIDNSKDFRSLPSAAAANGHLSSHDGGHSISHCASSKVDNALTNLNRLSDGRTPGVTDLKTSMRRVVQQIKSSTFSRHQPSGLGYMSGKCSGKVLFPYDLFVKLYNNDKLELRPCGLTNCGNSCYANAVLQCLVFTRPLSAYLLEGLHTKTCPKQYWCFTCELEDLLVKMKQGKSPLSPIRIISHIHNIGSNLGHGREEDAHEFLRYAIDAMQSMCLKEAGASALNPFSEESTLIQLTFGGYLRSKIKCMRCQGKSEQQERMMDLTVEINGDIGTLEEALTRFTATEVLDGDNKYKCNRCKSYERAKKKLTILEAPNILTIALKRFQSGKFGKLNKSVGFPEYLNLAPYMSGTDDKSPVYRLYAVVVHQDIMNASFSGHYVCYVKNTQGKWYKMDDSAVKSVELERVLKQSAYMLLYARCSPRAPSVLRKGMTHEQRNTSRSNSVFSRTTVARDHNPSRPYRANDEPFQVSNRRMVPRESDSSSSDSFSHFSCSDEGSCSSESTRDSTSTEEFSEYIFGDSDRASWDSPLRFPDENWRDGGPSRGLIYEEDSAEARDRKGQERSPSFFFYSDMSKECRKLTEQCSDSILHRRCSSGSRDRTAQTFYS